MKIFFTDEDDAAQVPTKATSGAGCYDLYASEDTKIYPGAVVSVGTGLRIAIEKDHVLHIFVRSGMAKEGISLANGVGVIDADYRGEVRILLANIGFEGVWSIKKGDRIAQCSVEKVIPIQWEEVTSLDYTERADGGFGSTGK